MKNTKNTLLYSILILSVFECSCVGEGLGENASKKLLKHAAIVLAPKLPESAKVLFENAARYHSVEAVKILAENSLKAIEVSGPTAVAVSEGVGCKAIKEISESINSVGHAWINKLTPVAWGIVIVCGVYQLYPIGKEVYEANYPTEDQKNIKEANTTRSRNTLKLLKTEEELRECLMNSKPGSEINAWRRPTACEDAAQMLKMLGAEDEVDRMTKVFYTYRK